MNIINDLMIGIVSGIISGLFSSHVIYRITKRKEKYIEVFCFWEKFLFDIMRNCGVNIPQEELNKIACVGKKGSVWHESITKILLSISDSDVVAEVSKQKQQLFNEAKIALQELYKWKKKMKL